MWGRERETDGDSVQWFVRTAPGRLKYIGTNRQDFPGTCTETNTLGIERKNGAYMENNVCTTAPRHWTHRGNQCLDQGSRNKLGFPQMARPQGPSPWGLCSLGWCVGHIHPCGAGAWADMKDYKGHVGAPAEHHTELCSVLCGSSSAPKRGAGQAAGMNAVFLLGRGNKLSG